MPKAKDKTKNADIMIPYTYTCPPSLKEASDEVRRKLAVEIGKDLTDSIYHRGLLQVVIESPVVYQCLLKKLKG